MRTLNKLAFLLEEVSAPSPGQQLLDRFLIGHPADGAWRTPAVETTVSAYLLLTGLENELERRAMEYGLVVARTAEQAARGADAVVVASRRPGAVANEFLNRIAVELAAPGATCFIHGALANTLAGARALVELARSRQVALLAGTPLGVTWRLPPVPLPKDSPIRRSLIVVQGPGPGAELHGLEGLLPVLEDRAGGEPGVKHLELLEGAEVWRAGDRGAWSTRLLAAAVSRSNSPQGDPVLDGRTQDLFGLGLIPKLARSPRAWIFTHADGCSSAILVLDGVVNDFNHAFELADGRVHSAQLFRAPPPAEHHFSLLASVVGEFFASGRAPWPLQRSLLTAGLLEVMSRPASRRRGGVATPELVLR